jgi:hypothetical protein
MPRGFTATYVRYGMGISPWLCERAEVAATVNPTTMAI